MARARRCRNSDVNEVLLEEAKTAKKKYADAIYLAKENA